MQITIDMIKELREKTGCGIMDCRSALEKSNGDMDLAMQELREKGLKTAEKRADRVASEGRLEVYIHSEGRLVVMVELNCETDFVSKNDSFLAFTKAVASLVAEHNPADVAALSALPLSQDNFGPSVEDVRKGLIGKIGENLAVRRFKRYAGGGQLASYLHGTRIGVIVEFTGDEDAQAKLLADIIKSEFRVIGFREEEADLEDVFLKLTTGAVH